MIRYTVVQNKNGKYGIKKVFWFLFIPFTIGYVDLDYDCANMTWSRFSKYFRNSCWRNDKKRVQELCIRKNLAT